MYSKSKKKSKTQKKRPIEVNMDSTRILRAVGDREAFYFYEALGRPTGQSARSLPDFLAKAKSVKLESLLFHLQRKDFQNWIKETLGDSKLARTMGKILPSNDEDVRTRICATVESRIEELSKTPVTLLVNEDLTVTPTNPSSQNLASRQSPIQRACTRIPSRD
jgi:hypothetical protein